MNIEYIILSISYWVGKHSYVNWPETAGRYSIGTRNIRGERLLQFCAINNLKIVNTLYKHKFRHLVTWISPDCKTRNQIDYILVQKENLNLIKNCRVYNSADIGSDHSLLMSKFNLPKTRRKQIRKQVTRYDVDKFKDDNYTYIFKQNIGGRLETLLIYGSKHRCRRAL